MAKFNFKYKVRIQFKPGLYVQFFPGVSEVADEFASHPYLAVVAEPVVESPAKAPPVEAPVAEDKPVPKVKS